MEPMTTRLREVLDDPDTVCESAYRAVHEAVDDTITSAAYDGTQDDGEIKEAVLSELDNVIEWAQEIRKKVEAVPGPVPYAEHALSSDPKVYPFVLVDSTGRVRDAYQTAEGAQRDAWQGDTVRPREEN